MKNRSADNLKHLLDEKITSLDMQITHLQAVRTTLCTHHRNMDTLLTMDLSGISIVEKKEHCLVTVEVDQNTTFEQEVELITAETEKYQLGRLHKASYGSMISVNSLVCTLCPAENTCGLSIKGRGTEFQNGIRKFLIMRKSIN